MKKRWGGCMKKRGGDRPIWSCMENEGLAGLSLRVMQTLTYPFL